MVSDSVSDESHDMKILIHFSGNQIPDFAPYFSMSQIVIELKEVPNTVIYSKIIYSF